MAGQGCWVATACLVAVAAVALAQERGGRAGLMPEPGSELVVNGGFEEPRLAGDEDWRVLKTPDALPGWMIEKGRDVDAIFTYWKPAGGRQSLDLDGIITQGVIHQDLKTEPGAWYIFRFAMAPSPEGPPKKAVEVEWNGKRLATLSREVGGRTNKDMRWEQLEYRVKATAATTRISFISITPPPSGMALDDVSVRRDPNQQDSPASSPATSPASRPAGR